MDAHLQQNSTIDFYIFNCWLLSFQQLTFAYLANKICVFNRLYSYLKRNWPIQQLIFTYLTIDIYIQQEINMLVSWGKC